MTQEEMKIELEELAVRFSEGWHEGIKIDASDIMLLNKAAQALAQEQEPVGHCDGYWCADLTCKKCYSADFRFKHITPPQRTWVGLTDEKRIEIDHLALSRVQAVQMTEAKLKELNT